MTSREDYPPDAVEAAKAILVELTHILGEYKDDMVIVGGWVPPLLMPDSEDHVGSTDVDVALNHLAITNEVYARISETLRQHDYRQDERQPFIWFKDVVFEGDPVTVEVDFLAGEYGGTGRGHRTQRVQDMLPRKARGADLLFSQSVARTVEARLPSGSIDRVSIKVAGIVPYIVMKSSALAMRIKQKDAYDIYYCLRHYPGGVTAVGDEFAPFVTHGLVVEAVDRLKDKFASPAHFGPQSVVAFEDVRGEDADMLARDVFERVQALISAICLHAREAG